MLPFQSSAQLVHGGVNSVRLDSCMIDNSYILFYIHINTQLMATSIGQWNYCSRCVENE